MSRIRLGSGARRCVIFGVGRSGTTALFAIAREILLQAVGDAPLDFRYEPYLWRNEEVDASGDVHRGRYDTRSLNPLGMYVHSSAPLFTTVAPDPDDPDAAAHARFMREVIGSESVGGWRLTKMIRGNGRVEAWLNAFPDLKVIGITREPFGSMNSVLNHFSFFGDEFHRSDKFRFLQEVEGRFGERPEHLEKAAYEQDFVWGLYWWRFMNQALLDAKQRFPDRVLLFDYTTLAAHKDDAAALICAHYELGAPPVLGGRSEAVGRLSHARHLSDRMMQTIEPFSRWYARFAQSDCFELRDRMDLSHFTSEAFLARFRSYEPGVVTMYPTMHSGVGWRFAAQALDQRIAMLGASRRRLSEAARGFAAAAAAPALHDAEPRATVVIPHYRAPDALAAAVGSALGQSLGGVRVIVVDDGSGSDCEARLARATSDPRVTLLRNSRNAGPGLARHRGILAAETPFFATLDADDLFAPDKLEREYTLLEGDENAVAFSDVEYVYKDAVSRWRLEAWASMDRRERLRAMLSRALTPPRDMLMSRSLYLRAGGFETGVKMYEDFALKLRLALSVSEWRATNHIGVYYDRGSGGLSAGDAARHGFHLYYVFLANAPALILELRAEAIELFATTLERFKALEPYARELREAIPPSFERIGREALMRKIEALRRLALVLKTRADIPMQERLRLLNALAREA